MNRFKFDESIRKISVVENGRSLSFRRIFLSLLNVDSFREHLYSESAGAVYSYKCNWDLYIQHIDRPPPHPPQPTLYAAAVQLLVFFFIQSKYWTHTAQYNRSGLATVSHYLPASLLKYQRFKLRATQAQMCFLPIPRRSLNILEWSTCQTRTSFPSLCLDYYCGWEFMNG